MKKYNTYYCIEYVLKIARGVRVDFLQDYEWFYGEKLIVKLEVLFERYKELQIRELNSTVYYPWMCLQNNTDRYKYNEYCLGRSIPSVPNLDVLGSIDSLFKSNGLYGVNVISEYPFFIKIDGTAHLLSYLEYAKKFFSTNLPLIWRIAEVLGVKLIPVILENNKRVRKFSFSTHLTKGAMYFQVNNVINEVSLVEFYIDLAHELAHQVLAVYMLADRVIESSHTTKIFSSARNVQRDAIRCFHGIIAQSYELIVISKLFEMDFIKSESLKKRLEHILKENKLKMKKTISQFRILCEFTELGKRIFAEISTFINNM
ncbi:MAG: hypothetical protein H6622_06865 [Halobacteriovoraceae bacterium]|nr:hypothetical protein [Halobacteriovoraceae bacterium]